jgi:predicted phosphodiesterase
MKLAILADIHANEQGLLAVADHIERWRPDTVVVAGDVINRGPQPKACLDFVRAQQREAGWQVLFGNHEGYVLRTGENSAPMSTALAEIFAPSRWTWDRINGDVADIQRWPAHLALPGPDNREVRLTHASMIHNRDGIFTRTPDADLPAKIGEGSPAVFAVGHTHIPLVRLFNQTLVVNAGSAGMPFDGDHRVSYAQLTWHAATGWAAEIIRLDYDWARAERDFADTGFLDEAGPLAEVMRWEFRRSSGLLFEWTHRFEPPVLAGEMTLERAVRQYLDEKGLTG